MDRNDEGSRPWGRVLRGDTEIDDPIAALRRAIAAVRAAPRDFEPRRRLRATAAEQGAWEPLAMLLSDEANATTDPSVAVACYEELADCYENLDQPEETISVMEAVVAIQPNEVGHHERLAWLYRRANAWQRAAASYERVADLGSDEVAYKALRAAARLYRDHGRAESAAASFRAIVARRPNDLDAWRALDEIYGELGRWADLALVREELAGRTETLIDKAAMMRAQARALEEAGDHRAATAVVERARTYASDDLSGLVDRVDVLARSGQGREAAEILATRVADAIARGAEPDEIAALRTRLAAILEDAVGDRAASARVLDELLRDAPRHLPALERLVWQASHDPDPRVHALALLQWAGALADTRARRAAYVEAARRFADANDHAASVRAYEQALALGAADDPGVAAEVAAAKAIHAVAVAKVDAGKGDLASAERRLRAILATTPGTIDAHDALAEILVATGRLDAANEHLRDALADAPAGTPPEQLARLVVRNARVCAALGDADEAHQLLHEAHHLARRDLPITLALGESCFARKLWRETAIHLGGLADHPDVAKHAVAVAAGLVKAAQAEVRGLRPQHAPKHFEAALRLDPACAPALHALAEVAIDKGDTVRGAELLEREAAATPEPEKRLRLWDALGDLAETVLGDPARAERCWREVIALPPSPARVPVLDKLLVLQRAHASDARGETAMALASELVSTPRWRELVIEAATAFAAADEHVRARDVAAQLIAHYPHDAAAVDAASAVALALGDGDTAVAWLRPALVAWDASASTTSVAPPAPLHAELWKRLGDAERIRGIEAKALAAYQRAIALAADSPGALAARRGIVELAARSGGSVATSLAALVEAEHDPLDAIAWARELAARVAHGKPELAEDARVAFELSIGLGVTLAATDRATLAALPTVAMASDRAYAAPIDDADRRALIDDDADLPLAELLEMLWEVAPQLCPTPQSALFEADVSDARRLAASSDAAAAAMYPPIAKLLGGPPVLIHVAASRRAASPVTVLFASPPVVVLGAELGQARARTVAADGHDEDAELRFMLGRAVELTRSRRIFAAQGATELARMIAALTAAFAATPPEPAVAREAERLRAALPVALRKRVADWLAGHVASAGAPLDAAAYVAGCARAADRAGLLACQRADIAIAHASHLVPLAASPRYLATRKKLRPRR